MSFLLHNRVTTPLFLLLGWLLLLSLSWATFGGDIGRVGGLWGGAAVVAAVGTVAGGDSREDCEDGEAVAVGDMLVLVGTPLGSCYSCCGRGLDTSR